MLIFFRRATHRSSIKEAHTWNGIISNLLVALSERVGTRAGLTKWAGCVPLLARTLQVLECFASLKAASDACYSADSI